MARTIFEAFGVVAVLIALALGPTHAAEISGVPTITDADTVVIEGKSIRLLGIDAPESDQICLDKSSAFVPCGIEARDALKNQFGGKPWRCQTTGKQTYGRVL